MKHDHIPLIDFHPEVQGGCLVAEISGEQYALLVAAKALHQDRPEESPLAIATVDPLNFHGILLPDAKVPAGDTRPVTLAQEHTSTVNAR